MTEFEIMKDRFIKSGMNIQVKENEIDHIVIWNKNGTPVYIIKFLFNEHGIYDRSEHIEVTA